MIDAPMNRCFIATVTDLRAEVIQFSEIIQVSTKRLPAPTKLTEEPSGGPHGAVGRRAIGVAVSITGVWRCLVRGCVVAANVQSVSG
jgi:hypothetical protein